MTQAPPFHPVAELFPALPEDELRALAADIKAHGLREPIWRHRGAIIDGRNRWHACRLAGVTPRFRDYAGPAEGLVDFVISLNLHRRHLDASQRAMIAAKIADLGQGARTDLAGNLAPIGAKSQPEAAELLKVGRRTVQRATQVRAQGAPELVKAVENGQVSVAAAADFAALPVEEQLAILDKMAPRAVRLASKKIRAEKMARNRDKRLATAEAKAARGVPLDVFAAALGRRFPVVVADPPWEDKTFGDAGKEKACENHYPTLSLDDICALPVPAIAADDVVLFLWTTARRFEDAIVVCKAWGFAYKTHAVWDKVKQAMGYWFLGQHECLIVATRGDIPAPAEGTRARSVYREERGPHSAKPAYYRALIDGYFPGVAKIELFARGDAPEGWTFWGFDAAPANAVRAAAGSPPGAENQGARAS